jgi:hypothetical protein
MSPLLSNILLDELAAGYFAFAMRERPRSPWPYRYLAACYAHLSRFEESREVLDRLHARVLARFPAAHAR